MIKSFLFALICIVSIAGAMRISLQKHRHEDFAKSFPLRRLRQANKHSLLKTRWSDMKAIDQPFVPHSVPLWV